MDTATFQAIAGQTITVTEAISSGRLQIDGDIAAFERFGSIFPLAAAQADEKDAPNIAPRQPYP